MDHMQMLPSATVQRARALEGIEAASGIELSPDGRTAFVVGDNSCFLYRLDLEAAALKAEGKTQLLAAPKGSDNKTEGISKKVKPDFEGLAFVPWFDASLKNVVRKAGDDPRAVQGCIMACGSGSKAQLRDYVALADPDPTGALPSAVFSVQPLFDALRADKRVVGEAKLNLEAVTVIGPSTLALFQRGNIAGGKNAVVTIDLEAFRLFLLDVKENKAPLLPPPYTVCHLQVPPSSSPSSYSAEVEAAKVFQGGVSGASTISLPISPEESSHGCAATSVAEPTSKEGALASGIEDTQGIGKGSGGRTVAVPLSEEARVASLAREQSHDAEVHHHQPHHLPHKASDLPSSDWILLSISYEGTDNEIDDGPVLGSRLALVPARALMRHAPRAISMSLEPAAAFSGSSPQPPLIDASALSALVTDASDSAHTPALVKIEGVAGTKAEVKAAAAAGEAEVLTISCVAVTDPDGAESQLLEVAFILPVSAVKASLASGLATTTTTI